MKTAAIFLMAVLMAGVSFGQMKYKPKVVVVVLGPKNPTFDESGFPDLHFYYTPELKLKENTLFKSSKNTNKNAWSSALGIGATAGKESNDYYTGKPAPIVEHEIHSGTAYIFDKNGTVNAETFSGKRKYFNNQTKFMVKFNKLKRNWETESFGNLMKDLVKKGNTLKLSKKAKKTSHLLGKKIYDFKVIDKGGKEIDIQSLVKENPATLLLFLYINPKYNLLKGKESGAGKKGKDYMNQVAQTAAADKQIAPLYNLEKGIFGKKTAR